jgi:SAM-dependent MidA family methyltransferase
VRQIIEQEIRERGPMPFSRYMEMCLYRPDLGFYSRDSEQFGKAGDFYTSSDVHAVFGRLLARQFDEIWRVLGSPPRIEILELGPGRGLFAQDVLDWSEKKFPDFFQALHYLLEESSPRLRERLRSNLIRHFNSGRASLHSADSPLKAWFSSEPLAISGDWTESPVGPGAGAEQILSPSSALTPPQRGDLAPEVPVIIFANEFFDALPVEILSSKGALRLDLQGDRLTEIWVPPSADELKFLDRYSVHPEPGERIEVPLLAYHCMLRLAASLRHGFIVAIDYGYTREEQLAGRHRGTLMAYRQHSASQNAYEAPGEQDLTAHVNFTALAEAAEENGLQTQPLLTQSQFLMGIGENNQFADAFEDCHLPQEHAKVALQLKHLVTPAGMGETFHVLVASKAVDAEHVAGLSGLSFARSRL